MTLTQLEQALAFDTQEKYCMEILFSLTDSAKFDCCWMGKMYSAEDRRDLYWFGLTPDGQYGFDYPSFRELADAPVFDGASLRQLWDRVRLEEINGCDPEVYAKSPGR